MKKTKVLIAHLDCDFVRTIEHQLLVCGYDVMTTAGTVDVLDNVHKSTPDVLLVDIAIDWQNLKSGGPSLPERINWPFTVGGVPVIYISDRQFTEINLCAKQRGAFELICKPLRSLDLLRIVEAAVQSQDRWPQTLSGLEPHLRS